MQYAAREHEGWRRDGDDGILFLDEDSVELIEEPPPGPARTLDTAVTRVWIRPYAGRWSRGSAPPYSISRSM
ncbi:MAG: hypothetical protein KDK70_23935 [Myxococcales bacterium]|nr:hypothetical protein [Myxococcales bacterium]